MTWGDDIATRLLGATTPAGFVQCLAIWEKPVAACQLITLEDLKAALGITDSSQDAELSRLIGVYSQAIENYLERQVCEAAREVVFVARTVCQMPILSLPQFPVSSVESIDLDGADQDLTNLVFDQNRGTLIATAAASWRITRYMHVKYTAGYAAVPPDLQDAVVQMIDQAMTSSGGGTGPLKSARVEGAVTESFYDPRVGGDAGSSGAGIVGRYAATLDYYRGERAFL